MIFLSPSLDERFFDIFIYMPRHKLIPHKMPIQDHEPPPERERCYGDGGKAIFESEAEAEQEASRLHEEEGAELGVYQCVHCLGWHFTSLDRSGKRLRGKR